MLQTTQGRTSITPAILKFEKRVTNGWGGRINYTYSRLKDNQFGESNFFSLNSTEAQNNYDLDAEYAIGLLDVPHKLVFSPIVELPFGEGKRGYRAASARRFSATGRSRRSSRSRAASRSRRTPTPTICRVSA